MRLYSALCARWAVSGTTDLEKLQERILELFCVLKEKDVKLQARVGGGKFAGKSCGRGVEGK